MVISEKEIKKVSLILFLIILVVLAFLVVKPVLFSVLSGLILAYIFLPVHKLTIKLVKNKTLSALLVSIVLLALVLVPLWFLLPVISKQVFELFKVSQGLEFGSFVRAVFPAASEQFIIQADLAAKSGFSRLASTIMNSLVDTLVNFFTISLHIFLGVFVFFFTLRDSERLKGFASGLLPFSREQERQFIKQFRDITQSILYGHVVGGVVQGALAALALYAFGIPNALILSIVAIILSIIPVIGPGFVYVPVTVYMVLTGNSLLALGYFLFNLLIVSSIDNVFRSHFVSKRTDLSQAIVLIGMVGGLFVFNVLGLIIGPLILAYLVTFLKAYKENKISSFFDDPS